MSLLTSYLPGLGESVTWKSRSSVDQYGDPTFSNTSISVIWFDQKRRIRSGGHDDVICDAFCLTDSAVQQGDVLTRDGKDWPVLDVEVVKAFGGRSLRIVNMSKNQA